MPRAFAHRWFLLASAQPYSLETSIAALVLPDSSPSHPAAVVTSTHSTIPPQSGQKSPVTLPK